MRRRSRTVTWIVAGVMLLSTMLTPRPSGAYRVPLEPPPQKGDPDDPSDFATPQLPTSGSQRGFVASTSVRPIIVMVMPVAPGVYVAFKIQIPSYSNRGSKSAR